MQPRWRHGRDHASLVSERARPRSAAGQSVVMAFGAVLVLLAGYEIVEYRWMRGLDPQRVHVYQHLVGLAAVLVAAIIAAHLVLRGSPSLFASSSGRRDSDIDFDDGRDSAADAASVERGLHFAEWFILMRWIAALMAFLLVFVAIPVMQYLPFDLWPPLGGAIVALIVLNVTYTVLLRRRRAVRALLEAQAYGDLIILTVLLHFSGGIENPLTTLMFFHVIIAGIILDRRRCYFVAGAASALFALLATLEYTEVIAHYTLAVVPHPLSDGVQIHAAHDPQFVLSIVALHTAVLFLTAYFATSIVGELRRGEQEQSRIHARALRAEKLAAIGDLAGRVAHEVNNPIAIISAKARLLLSDHRHDISAHAAGELAKITDLADRIAGIAQGLLASCRPPLGVAAPCDAGRIVRNALAMIAPAAGAAGVRVTDALGDGLPPVLVNAGEIERVFLNLFLNALDAMPHGGRLSVSADVDAAASFPARELRVTVADDGVGIPPEIRDRIFEPFVSTKPPGKGTGLGLSICLGLMRGNGGTIDVDSEPGRGTRVVLRLPVVSPAVSRAAVESPARDTAVAEPA